MKKNVLIIILFTSVFVFLYYLFSISSSSTTPLSSNTNSFSTSSNTENVSTNTMLTMEEVSKHNSKSSCYLVIKNEVYDVTSYINRHPGGVRSITSYCGKEATGIFASIHSNFAWNLLKNYDIGTLIT